MDKTGGAAFPQHGWTKDPEIQQRMQDQGGMTLRDYFAGKALVALFACEANPRVGRDVEPYNSSEAHREYTAKEAYALADAMLAARGAA